MQASDDLLFLLIQEHNEEAYKVLFERYDVIIKSYIKKYKIILKKYDVNFSEIYYELLTTYICSLKKYKIYYGNSLRTYINNCLEKEMFKYTRKLRNSIKCIDHDDDILNFIIDRKNDPINYSIGEDLKKEIESYLSKKEMNIFNMLIRGVSYNEMASKLNITNKQLYNCVSRIKTKTKLIMEN